MVAVEAGFTPPISPLETDAKPPKISPKVTKSKKLKSKNSQSQLSTSSSFVKPPSQPSEMIWQQLGGQFGWLARGDRVPEEEREPFTRPKLRQIYNALPFIFRYSMYYFKNYSNRNKLFINTFQPLKHKPYYGVPCGGIGCGSIGRDFRGGFCKFSLRPGAVEQKVDMIKANQFILTLRRDGKTLHQVVLSAVPFAQNAGNNGVANGETKKDGDVALSVWDFSLHPSNVTYRGLYPRSWTRFEVPEHKVAVVCRQVSPVIPNNYKDSSLPSTVFSFKIENNSDLPLDASVTFTFRNGTGNRRWEDEGNCSAQEFHNEKVRGVTLDHSISQMQCTYAVGAVESESNTATVCHAFDPASSGESIWNALVESGELPEIADNNCPSTRLGVGVCLKTTVAPNSASANDMEFALVWHMPVVQFGSRRRQLKRWYTRFFESSDALKEAAAICTYALSNYKQWEKEIEEWQDTVLKHPNLPDWFKSALFNELYFLTDGGSVWFDFDEEWPKQETQMSSYTANLFKQYGRFGYLESWEYRMINTYDVHFYASFALAELFPSLEHVLQADMKDQIDHHDEVSVKYHMEGDMAPRKTHKRVPHDVGNPLDDPWLSTNAYIMHDTGKWKDLNLKFVLTSYRDYHSVLNHDKSFLEFVWPAVKNLIEEGLKHWDLNGDGMIENFGAADQTYDAWKMEGVSAYCGSLWLASLKVGVVMSKEIGESQEVFEAKLWNGKYYNFDEGSLCKSTIMADQLCGYWYLESIDPAMAADLLPKDHVQAALQTIYENNVLKFGGGRLGAVNGMCANGKIDRSYIQSDEMWTGITYALSSFYMQQGDVQRGFDVAWGCYDACFNRSGLQFQTPEAMYQKKFYRAIGYMRPLAIWSMYTALRTRFDLLNTDSQLLKHVRTSVPDFGPVSGEEKDEFESAIVDVLKSNGVELDDKDDFEAKVLK
ncbi:hypothetical protein DdX_21439 [Ditylenchus destructor]|uniref:Non-lysosomal glucosylceramidase n=1 Tax=Ditylenchus destructor TaxID=166010 RepID=A0AAD4MFI9_9BILA|nr:hypothetical protein DdX_21439 [Ditylenchus destructor]